MPNATSKNSGRFQKGQHWRSPQPWWDRSWLAEHYLTLGKSAADIAREGCVTENAILFWLKKHGIKTRSMQEVRAAKQWGASGENNPMWGKFGDLNPRWKGGVTAERQAFYASDEWRKACSAVWARDNATCCRCGVNRKSDPDVAMHVHHIQPFAVVAMRSAVDNLVLLCKPCHQFVHSRKNVLREYLP